MNNNTPTKTDKFYDAFPIFSISSIPVIITVLFTGIQGWIFAIFAIIFTTILLVIISVLLSGICALAIKEKISSHKFSKHIIITFGILCAAIFFHRSNAYYGAPRSAFKLATGFRPLFEIKVMSFDEANWTDYTFFLKYKSNPDYNMKIINNKKFEKNELREDSICIYRNADRVYCEICIDKNLTDGRIMYMAQ